MLLSQCNAGRVNWASEIKHLLYRFRFGYVWEQQYVTNEDLFLEQLKLCVLDCDRQMWSLNMSSFPKLRTLQLFKTDLKAETYLDLFIPTGLRISLAKFRIGNHDLEIERGRHNRVPVNERYCKLCRAQNLLYVEDEYHVLLKCQFYKDLRDIYLVTTGSLKLVYIC